MHRFNPVMVFGLLVLLCGLDVGFASSKDQGVPFYLKRNVERPLIQTHLVQSEISENAHESKTGNIASIEITLTRLIDQDIALTIQRKGSADKEDYLIFDEAHNQIIEDDQVLIQAGESKRVISVMALQDADYHEPLEELVVYFRYTHEGRTFKTAPSTISIRDTSGRQRGTAKNNLTLINVQLDNNSHMEEDEPGYPIPGTSLMAHAIVHVGIDEVTDSPVDYVLYNPMFLTPPPYITTYMTQGEDYTLYNEQGNVVTLPLQATMEPGQTQNSFYIRYLDDTQAESGEMQRFALTNLVGAYPGNAYVWIGIPYYVYDDDGAGDILQIDATQYFTETLSDQTGGHRIHQISAGHDHACAILMTSDWIMGSLACWGRGEGGKLGVGNQLNQQSPVLVQPPTGALGWLKVSAGLMHTCAIASDNRMYCWGIDHASYAGFPDTHPYSILGVASIEDIVMSPQVISLFFNSQAPIQWKDVSVGDRSTCALGMDDQAYCWGASGLGVGPLDDPYVPDFYNLDFNFLGPSSPVVTTTGTWSQVSRGHGHGCAVAGDYYTYNQRPMYCWGSNTRGQIGDGGSLDTIPWTGVATASQVQQPTEVSGWKSVEAGQSFTCGLSYGNQVYCWGDLAYDGTENGDVNIVPTPALLPTPSGNNEWKKLLPAHGRQICGIAQDDQMYCWGRVGSVTGQGQDIIYTPMMVPLPPGETGWLTGSAGQEFACGKAMPSGKAYCWGDDAFGRLGNGPILNDQSTPQLVNF